MLERLPRREREVFETLCRLGEGSTSVVRLALGGNLNDSTVRTLLARLERKGLVTRSSDGVTLYRPAPDPKPMADAALRQMIDTFFAGSAASAATALLGMAKDMDADELSALRAIIDTMEPDQ